MNHERSLGPAISRDLHWVSVLLRLAIGGRRARALSCERDGEATSPPRRPWRRKGPRGDARDTRGHAGSRTATLPPRAPSCRALPCCVSPVPNKLASSDSAFQPRLDFALGRPRLGSWRRALGATRGERTGRKVRAESLRWQGALPRCRDGDARSGRPSAEAGALEALRRMSLLVALQKASRADALRRRGLGVKGQAFDRNTVLNVSNARWVRGLGAPGPACWRVGDDSS